MLIAEEKTGAYFNGCFFFCWLAPIYAELETVSKRKTCCSLSPRRRGEQPVATLAAPRKERTKKAWAFHLRH